MTLMNLDQPEGEVVGKFEAGRIFCIGMNYVEHIEELNSKRPDEPVVFMKPRESLVPAGQRVPFPPHGKDLHFETELVVLIGEEGNPQDDRDALAMVCGAGLGFDLTLRDVQNRLKGAGHPWEASKAFECSALVSDFIEIGEGFDFTSVSFTGTINGEIRQEGRSGDMIFPVAVLVRHIASIWKLKPGDLIFTGTPPGVGSLQRGDRIEASSPLLGRYTWQMVTD